ncbi:hypothetical protein [Dyella acidisoli]|nr:hypothetical protein [Dyella acidisoli]
MLHELRWRKPPRDHRRLWAALAIALVLHVLFVAVVWYEMKATPMPPQVVRVQFDQGIQVRFITRSSAPSKAPPPFALPPPPLAREPVSKNAMTLRMPASSTPPPAPATSVPHPALFDRTGQIVLPASASSAPSADYVQHGPQGDAQIMQHRAGAQYQSAPNQFKQYFPPPHESFVAGVLRKLNGSESNSKSVDLPGGIHLKCQKVLGIPTPNCGIPPDPPPPTDGDERLNMAPASLVKGNALPKPDLATCIADYRAGKPLAQGCPVDTPARAVDAEKKRPGP